MGLNNKPTPEPPTIDLKPEPEVIDLVSDEEEVSRDEEMTMAGDAKGFEPTPEVEVLDLVSDEEMAVDKEDIEPGFEVGDPVSDEKDASQDGETKEDEEDDIARI